MIYNIKLFLRNLIIYIWEYPKPKSRGCTGKAKKPNSKSERTMQKGKRKYKAMAEFREHVENTQNIFTKGPIWNYYDLLRWGGGNWSNKRLEGGAILYFSRYEGKKIICLLLACMLRRDSFLVIIVETRRPIKQLARCHVFYPTFRHYFKPLLICH